jgi:hypothetical protein
MINFETPLLKKLDNKTHNALFLLSHSHQQLSFFNLHITSHYVLGVFQLLLTLWHIKKIKLQLFLNEIEIIALCEVGAPTHPEWEIIPF